MQIKYSKSLGGGFQGHPKDVWKCEEYTDRYKPAVFVGMYDLRDYWALWMHRSKAYVFWCGGDILNLDRGFLLNDGKLKTFSKILPGFKLFIQYILSKAEHWCENHVERDLLFKQGIELIYVTPSYFGKVDMPITYKSSKQAKVYVSCGTGRQKEYGFDTIERIAEWCPNIKFYLYGDSWETKHKNVIIKGRIPIEQMNRETADMQCGLRLNKFDGFSEILAMAVLRGQYAISKIKYPHIPSWENDEDLVGLLNLLATMQQPNREARNFYRHIINKFPWNHA